MQFFSVLFIEILKLVKRVLENNICFALCDMFNINRWYNLFFYSLLLDSKFLSVPKNFFFFKNIFVGI